MTAAIALVAALVVPSAGGVATAQQEFGDFSISPTSGPAGTSIAAEGCGWGLGASVTIWWDRDEALGDVPTDDGCLDGAVTAPDGSPGAHELTAGDRVDGPEATFTLEESSEPDPEPDPDPDPGDGLRTEQLQAIDRMRQDAVSEEVSVDWDGGLPVGVDGRWVFDDTDIVHSALTFLADHATGFLLDNPAQGLFLEGITTSPERVRHLRFGQHVAGIPVHDAQLLVAVEDGDVTGVSGETLPETDVQGAVRPEVQRLATAGSREGLVGAGQAEDAARAAVPADTTHVPGEPQRVIYDAGLSDEDVAADTPAHAWRVVVYGGAGTWEVVVDARDGDPLSVQSTTETHDDFKWKIFDANGGSGWNMFCTGVNLKRDRWYDEDGEWGNASPDRIGRLAFEFLGKTVDYMHDEFGAHSHKGPDRHKDKVFVHAGVPNALYKPACHAMAFADGWLTQDVLAHEFTHGLVDHSSGLEYQDQSGALNESFADVFGEIVDTGVTQPVASTSITNWKHGEGTPGGVNRRLDDPPRQNQPDHTDPAFDGSGTGLRSVANGQGYCADDNGCVHFNSGIPNKVAFLLLQSPGTTNTHAGLEIDGIGVERGEELYWNVMRHRLGEHADFNDAAREMTELASAWASGSGNHGFTYDHVCSVRNAWASVGVREGGADLNCDGIPNRRDSDDDGDGWDDTTDNCPLRPNPGQTDSDGDGSGDACDGDRDGDGVPNGRDNCPRTANPGQENEFGNGWGDACGDLDDDGVVDGQDNCVRTANPDQGDADGDGDGDACDPDADDDGVANDTDNCPVHANPGQADRNSNGTGDACDDPELGGEGDGVYDVDDNCPDAYNPDQVNTDGADDGGDRCDTDDDDDGVSDAADNCEDTVNPGQEDRDGDRTGDACDVCPDTPDDQTDTDGDGAGDVCDPDDDGDGVPDDEDNCPEDANARQHDLNQNGSGLPCDSGDQAILSDVDDLRRELHASLAGEFGDPGAGVEFPLDLCNPTWCDQQPWVDPERTTTRVEVVTTDPDLRARIVREDGTGVVDTHVADRGDGKVTKVAEFTQDADTRFSSPEDVPGADDEGGFSARSAGTGQPAQQDGSGADYTGMGYELQLYPSPDTDGEVTVEVSVSSEQRSLAATLPSHTCPPGDPEACSEQFSDVPTDHPFSSEIAWMVDHHLADGYRDGTFRPVRPVSRQAAAAFLYRLAGEPAVTHTTDFTDVPADHPFHDAISWADANGIVTGYPDGTFRPGHTATRQAMAAFLARYDAGGDVPEAGTSSFSDVPAGHPFHDEIAWMAGRHIADGYGDGTYRPGRNVARQASAAFLHRHPGGG